MANEPRPLMSPLAPEGKHSRAIQPSSPYQVSFCHAECTGVNNKASLGLKAAGLHSCLFLRTTVRRSLPETTVNGTPQNADSHSPDCEPMENWPEPLSPRGGVVGSQVPGAVRNLPIWEAASYRDRRRRPSGRCERPTTVESWRQLVCARVPEIAGYKICWKIALVTFPPQGGQRP